MVKPFSEPVYVTRPFLPPLERFSEGLQEIWRNRWLTNNGPIERQFKEDLKKYLNTENVCLFNNGTLALQIGLQGLNISGEVITTPFTFVATTHALYWNKIRPVFVDIEPDYYTLDPEKVEAAITPWTTAILAVHVYGQPCRLDALEAIARRHHLRLIYDAAHAFGVRVNQQSIARFGDLSMFSFHATKLFHTFEGGMLCFGESKCARLFDYLKNFGFENELEVVMPGTNAKMTEIQALMGSLVLTSMEEIILSRKTIYDLYMERLSDIPGIQLPREPLPGVDYNYAYMPIQIVEDDFGISRDQLYDRLKEYNVFARKYFYPLICDYACYRHVHVTEPLTTARAVSSRILTLPIYSELSLDDVNQICDIIVAIQKCKH